MATHVHQISGVKPPCSLIYASCELRTEEKQFLKMNVTLTTTSLTQGGTVSDKIAHSFSPEASETSNRKNVRPHPPPSPNTNGVCGGTEKNPLHDDF